jgi:proteic killer suppression protein
MSLRRKTVLHGSRESVIINKMIESFRDKATEDLYHGKATARARQFAADMIPVALRKLDMLNAAKDLQDLLSPPGNRLEALKGKLRGFYSIRVNEQWRIVFRWHQRSAHDVQLTDYH